MGEVAHPAQKTTGDTRRAAGSARDLVRAIGSDADAEHARTAVDDLFKLFLGIEIEPHRNAEAIAERISQQSGAGRGANQGERRGIELERSRRSSLASSTGE